jgi:prepilin-type N-terminal cleavage/methylation domain-containing protein
MKKLNNQGFTLLEIIIVIIIIGVLASLAMPRFFSTVEYSRATEALASLQTTRSAIERCYIQTNAYASCGTFADLDVADPATSPGAHFTYAIGTAATSFNVTATRNTRNGGAGGSITIRQDNTAGTVTKSGTAPFSGIK